MTEYATLDDLLADDGSEGEDFTTPAGRTVRVRAISRLEWLLVGKGTEDAAEIERRMLRAGLINPALTDAQIKKWQAMPGQIKEIGAVAGAVRDLSGFGEGAAKSDVDQVRDGS